MSEGFTDRMRALAARVRSQASRTTLAGAPGLDQRPNTLAIVRRVWPAGKIGDGDPIDTTLVTLTPNPKIIEIGTFEVASSGGTYEQGDLKVLHITPWTSDAEQAPGTYTEAQLVPTLDPGSRGVEIIYLVTGPDAGEYRRVTASVDRVIGWSLVLRRRTRPTP